VNTADYLLEQGLDDRVVLIAGHAHWTYADLRAASARLAAELVQAGVQPLDRVGILGNNSLFWVAAYLAVLKLGATAVPFPVTALPDSIAAMQDVAHCRLLCAETKAYRRLAVSWPADLPTIFDSVLDQSGESCWPIGPTTELDQVAALMLTSGTTAKPRAVCVTHRNLQANTNSIIEYLDLTHADRILAILPFFYCFGTSLLHTHLRVGGSLALVNSFAFPEVVLDVMERQQCTGFAGVPSNYQTLLRNSTFPQRPWSHLRKIQQAGGKLSTILIEELVRAVPQARVFVMYGQTEATARLSYLPPELLSSKLGSIGRGIPDVTLRVLNEAGQEVKPGETGEIYAWGDNICAGYLNEPEASAAKFVDGALRTGDLATVDEDGFIYIVDRAADFIKSYGYRVSSQQIEACVLELPEVIAAAAIGEPDAVRGEAIKVFVVLRPGTTLSATDIIGHCSQRLTTYMIPQTVIPIDQLPLNAHGKIVKTELRKLAAQATQVVV
jgi:acyl-CoA synthetase (AMP-forming)/AMP-acid ligase II